MKPKATTLFSGGRTGTARRHRVLAATFTGVCLAVMLAIPLALLAAEGGSKTQPDLQVGGFTVFGTNVAGSTATTSGWGNVYIDGSLQVNSNLHVTGSIISTNLLQANRVALTRRDQILTQGATIQPAGSYLRIRGDTVPVTLGTPQIAPGSPGQLITLQGVANSVRVTLVNSNGLRTNMEQPFSLGEFDTIQFIFDDSTTNWIEINRSLNRWN